MGIIKKCIFVIFLIILLFPTIYAEDYYADVDITVDNSGFISIDGITNHPELLINNTELYTSKKQSYWLLNITKEDIFSDFVYSLTFPSGSSINYVKSSGSIRIEDNLGKLTVKGFGQNKSFSIVVQYQVEKAIASAETTDTTILLIILVVGFIVVFLFIRRVFKRSGKEKVSSEIKEGRTGYSYSGLNERQKEIMNILIKEKRPMTQTEIQKELGIPKAAVSRNISSLELKGLVEKEKIGMSNLIKLKKP